MLIKNDNVLEIIVFGKGYGESILIRVYNDCFILIDSFLDNDGVPVAQIYLEQNGFTVDNIIGIVCSHWDNDHIRGISDIIKKHNGTVSVYSPLVFSKKEVLSYLLCLNDKNEKSDFIEILNLCKSGKAHYCQAMSHLNLFEKELHNKSITFKALTPNDDQVRIFIESLLIPKSGDVKEVHFFERNDISVVTYLEHTIDSIIFGGDFENTALYDWRRLVNDFSFLNKSHVIKIPHHGSNNAYSEELFDKLTDKPISIITRFNNSDLPEEETLNQIISKSSKTYIVGGKKSPDKHLSQDIKKYSISGMTQRMMINNKKIGYVKLTKSVDTDWIIEKFGAVEEY